MVKMKGNLQHSTPQSCTATPWLTRAPLRLRTDHYCAWEKQPAKVFHSHLVDFDYEIR